MQQAEFFKHHSAILSHQDCTPSSDYNTNLLDALNIDLVLCCRWKEVEDRISGIGSDITALHLCAAFTVLKRLPIPPPKECLDRLSQKVLLVLPDLNGWHFTSLLHACAKLWYTDSKFLDIVIQSAHDANKLGTFKPFHCSWCIYSVGVLTKLQGRLQGLTSIHAMAHTRSLNQMFLHGLADTVIANGFEAEFSSKGLANIFYGLSLARCPHRGLLNLLSIEASRQERIEKFNEQEISLIVYSMGQLKFHHKVLVSKLHELLAKPEVLREFREQGLCMVLFGIAYSGMSMPIWALRPIVWEVCRPYRLKGFSNKHLAVVVYSLGLLRVKNPNVYDIFVRELSRTDRADRLKTNPRSYVTMLYGIVRARVAPSTILVLARLLTANENTCRLCERGLAITVYCLGLISAQVDLSFMSSDLAIEVSQPKRLEKFSSQQLSYMLYALARAKLFTYWEKQSLERLIRFALRPERITSYEGQGIAIIVFALAQMGIAAANYHNLLAAEALNQIQSMQNEGLAMMIYGWGLVRFQEEKAMIFCLEEAIKGHRLQSFTEQGLSNVLFGLLRMGCQSKAQLGLIVAEIQRRVFPKFRYVVRPEFLIELLEADVVDQTTKHKLQEILKIILIRFKKQGMTLWGEYEKKKLKWVSI